MFGTLSIQMLFPQVVMAMLSFARYEILWSFIHANCLPDNRRIKDPVTDDRLDELIHWSVELYRMIEDYGDCECGMSLKVFSWVKSYPPNFSVWGQNLAEKVIYRDFFILAGLLPVLQYGRSSMSEYFNTADRLG